jgi:hypothetical protein
MKALNTRLNRIVKAFLYSAASIVVSPVFAIDGVVEINQTRADAGGITAGDQPGFPVEITETGSYRLTGNLELPDQFTGGILIQADNVQLDLNGFRIAGVVVCSDSGASISCTPDDGDSVGIVLFNANHVTIYDGTIRGMGLLGIGVAGTSLNTHIQGVTVISNNGAGIAVGENAVITQSLAVDNAGFGISLASGEVIDCQAFGNRTFGIFNQGGGLIRGSLANGNGTQGIALSGAGQVHDNYSNNNGGFGISLNPLAAQWGNVADSNTGGTIGSGISLGPSLCDGVVCP